MDEKSATYPVLDSEKCPNSSFDEAHPQNAVRKNLSAPCACRKNQRPLPNPIPYTHMGHASSVNSLKESLSLLTDIPLAEIKIVEVRKVVERITENVDCPLPPDEDNVIRRGDERMLVLAESHLGHTCQYAVTVVSLIVWNGVDSDLANQAYHVAKERLAPSQRFLDRGCARNAEKSCFCQGQGENMGVSFSLGCSWNTYTKGCKFKRSKKPNKFHLGHNSNDEDVEAVSDIIHQMADAFSPKLKRFAPGAFENQIEIEQRAPDCCLGRGPFFRPFSSVTVCLDFSAHRHKDLNNMIGGCTVVATFLKNSSDMPDDPAFPSNEQLHILPQYFLADSQLPDYPSKSFRGVGLALTHGSLLFEYARGEWHATSPVIHPNRYNPTRVSFVFYQHQGLMAPGHGYRPNWKDSRIHSILTKMKSDDKKPVFKTKSPRHPESHPLLTYVSPHRALYATHVPDSEVPLLSLADDRWMMSKRDTFEEMEGQEMDYIMHLLDNEDALESALGEAAEPDTSGDTEKSSNSSTVVKMVPQDDSELKTIMLDGELVATRTPIVSDPPVNLSHLPQTVNAAKVPPIIVAKSSPIVPASNNVQPIVAGANNVPAIVASTMNFPAIVPKIAPKMVPAIVSTINEPSAALESRSNVPENSLTGLAVGSMIRMNSTVGSTLNDAPAIPTVTSVSYQSFPSSPATINSPPTSGIVPNASQNPPSRQSLDYSRTGLISSAPYSPPSVNYQSPNPKLTSPKKQGSELTPIKLEDKRCQCPVCFKTFSTSGNANRHIKATHVGKDNLVKRKNYSSESTEAKRSKLASSPDNSPAYSPNSPSSHYTPNFGSQMVADRFVTFQEQQNSYEQDVTFNGQGLSNSAHYQYDRDNSVQDPFSELPPNLHLSHQLDPIAPDNFSSSPQTVYLTQGATRVAVADEYKPSGGVGAFDEAASQPQLQQYVNPNESYGRDPQYDCNNGTNHSSYYANYPVYTNDELKTTEYAPSNGYTKIVPVENNGVYHNFPNYLSL